MVSVDRALPKCLPGCCVLALPHPVLVKVLVLVLLLQEPVQPVQHLHQIPLVIRGSMAMQKHHSLWKSPVVIYHKLNICRHLLALVEGNCMQPPC
jgi:hypothetical protein